MGVPIPHSIPTRFQTRFSYSVTVTGPHDTHDDFENSSSVYLHSAEFTDRNITVHMFGEIALVLSVKEIVFVKKRLSCLILNCIGTLFQAWTSITKKARRITENYTFKII